MTEAMEALSEAHDLLNTRLFVYCLLYTTEICIMNVGVRDIDYVTEHLRIHFAAMMENEEAQEEKAGAVGPEAAKDGSFGSVLHERSRWVCANSSVFTSNLVVMNDCTFYDHSQSQYAFLSMCHDDAGTTTIFSVIS